METVVKRDGTQVPFNEMKIKKAISAANHEVEVHERIPEDKIQDIIYDVDRFAYTATVEEIQDLIESKLMEAGYYNLAKHYIQYRYSRMLVRQSNSTDEDILSLIRMDNKELNEENSNKNVQLASTQRDYIAGIVSRDVSQRIMLPEKVIQAHKDGILHFHDMDYFIQPIFNCCLINIKDIFDNGTVMNGKMIETPKSFRVACTIMTQVIATVASNQYGGQSVNVRHLGKYLRLSREKHEKLVKKALNGEKISESESELLWNNSEFKKSFEAMKDVPDEVKDNVAIFLSNILTARELRDGVQTIQYQINTLMTTNGQAPFVTLFLEIPEGDEFETEIVMIIEEILRQRLEGIKNEKGVFITPAFPKLVYVLDEHNALKGGKYDNVTRLAVKCSAKRMYPDYISAKKMRENYAGNVFSPMGCRSFLSPWYDENGEVKFEGRFNQGVVSINLPQIGICAKGDMERFWELFEERLAICFEAMMCRHHALEGTVSDVSPIHWQHGAIARLKPGETIDKLLHGGYSTMSLGYIGLYEVTKLMTGESHTELEGQKFAMKVINHMRAKCDQWKAMTDIGFALYGTPAESLCYRFAEVDRQKFGDIKDITDKGYYTNSYHVDVREKIDIFSKLKFESQFQPISSGGCISYGEVPNMEKNLSALESVVQFIYDNIQYAEFNTKSDYCMECGYAGEIIINDDMEWECPNCGNKDHRKMNVTRRTCGYLGENFWNVGKTKEINSRVLHL